MAISRYNAGEFVWVTRPDGTQVQVVHLPPIRWNNYPYTLVQATSADDLPGLAFKAYGETQNYWFVAEMNPDIVCPDDLQAGQTVFIPTGKPN